VIDPLFFSVEASCQTRYSRLAAGTRCCSGGASPTTSEPQSLEASGYLVAQIIEAKKWLSTMGEVYVKFILQNNALLFPIQHMLNATANA